MFFGGSLSFSELSVFCLSNEIMRTISGPSTEEITLRFTAITIVFPSPYLLEDPGAQTYLGNQKFPDFIFMHMGVSPAYMSVYELYVWCLWIPCN